MWYVERDAFSRPSIPTYPHLQDTGGFFVAVLERKESHRLWKARRACSLLRPRALLLRSTFFSLVIWVRGTRDTASHIACRLSYIKEKYIMMIKKGFLLAIHMCQPSIFKFVIQESFSYAYEIRPSPTHSSSNASSPKPGQRQ